MKNIHFYSHFDLTTPDGVIEKFLEKKVDFGICLIKITNISSNFIGYSLEIENIIFNIKSTLAQIGINGILKDLYFDKKNNIAEVKVQLQTFSKLGEDFLKYLDIGAYIGKLFAKDETRKVKDPDYLLRMFGRCDWYSEPLLSIGNPLDKDELVLEKINGFAVAFLKLKNGTISYKESIHNFIPTLALMLKHKEISTRKLLFLHQQWNPDFPKIVKKDTFLLVRTLPLHIRTVFGLVKSESLPRGYYHTSASVLQPDTKASGDIFELYGNSDQKISEIPLEFYTLSPYREHVFFADRDQLQSCLENEKKVFDAFNTSPKIHNALTSTFIVKGKQLLDLSQNDWIIREGIKRTFPGIEHSTRQALLVKKYVIDQPQYPILKSIEKNLITSQGILFSNYFPSPLLKGLILSSKIQSIIKGIYFKYPSRSNNYFFSQEDRSFLLDLAKFGIPTYWVDDVSKKILKYVVKTNKETGMFVPLNLINIFNKATIIGVYGSNLLEGNFEDELRKLLIGLIKMKKKLTHPLLNDSIPIGLLTGGGPGVMEVGNRVAKNLKILSCANIVDFSKKGQRVVNEQRANPHIDAKMTYRLDKLVERQAEFHLDFPIFMPGGIGMDFEYCLEEVRRKTGSAKITPILLFGSQQYWMSKITPRFQCNRKSGTIKGSEWISNCFYQVESAEQALKIYKAYFTDKLQIGKNGPIYDKGFCYKL